ncbi:class I SAM-dependent methyltransferase [candidate division TA06 bacterium]|nr:class I SAM-dependent methyltransferase [candidate division TA06 bacterium]
MEDLWKRRYDYLALKNIPDWQKSCWWDPETIFAQQKFIFKQAKELFHQKIKIADIGCGPGYYYQLLSDMGHEVVGIDYSLNTLLLAKERNPAQAQKLSQADANHLPLKSGTFDLVLGMGILLSAEYPVKLVRELHRVLKPDGRILITTLVQQGLWELPFYPLYCLRNCDGFPSTDSFPLKLIKSQQTLCPRPVDDPEIIMKRYTVRAIRKSLTDLGFGSIKLRFQGRFPFFPHLLNSFVLNASAVKK